MTQSHVLYWIWLSLNLSPASKSADLLLEHFDGSAQKIFEAAKEEYEALGLRKELIEKLCNKDSTEARRVYYRCKDAGIWLLPYDDPGFPERLRTIGKKPVLLYGLGKKLDFNNDLYVSIVGTRNMTSYGKRNAYTIAYDLARAGAIVVSGMAAGIDAIAHRGALDAGGNTVAVFGCGVDITYPKENTSLKFEIEKKATILSEYAPGVRPSKATFPARNRIVSGLSQGTFVVEGNRNSGSLITASYAKNQGRDIYALPGMVGERNSEGTNDLLREGATPVTSAFDILENYTLLYPDKLFLERVPLYHPQIVLTEPKKESKAKRSAIKKADDEEVETEKADEKPQDTVKSSKKDKKTSRIAEKAPLELSEQGRAIYEELCISDEPLTVDQLASRTRLPVADLLTELTLMEISGVITSIAGGRFAL